MNAPSQGTDRQRIVNLERQIADLRRLIPRMNQPRNDARLGRYRQTRLAITTAGGGTYGELSDIGFFRINFIDQTTGLTYFPEVERKNSQRDYDVWVKNVYQSHIPEGSIILVHQYNSPESGTVGQWYTEWSVQRCCEFAGSETFSSGIFVSISGDSADDEAGDNAGSMGIIGGLGVSSGIFTSSFSGNRSYILNMSFRVEMTDNGLVAGDDGHVTMTFTTVPSTVSRIAKVTFEGPLNIGAIRNAMMTMRIPYATTQLKITGSSSIGAVTVHHRSTFLETERSFV